MLDIVDNIIYLNLDQEEKILAWKYLLQNLSLDRINKEFELYKNACLFYLNSFNGIESAIKSLFNVNYKGHDFYPNFRNIIISEAGQTNHPHYFFRIRKLNRSVYFDINDSNQVIPESFDFEEIQTLSDIWERPAEQVKEYQRLNKPLNSVLYTSLMPSTAILETNVCERKDLFFLIVYRSKRKIVYNDCCKFVCYNELTESENMKRFIIFQFLRNEFSRVLPESYNSEYQYCAAESISRKFFISDNVDGIQYPSTRGLGHSNFAFWSATAKKCLDVVGLRCCSIDKKKGQQSLLKILVDCFWNAELNRFEYYSPFSDKSKLIFGDPLLEILMSK